MPAKGEKSRLPRYFGPGSNFYPSQVAFNPPRNPFHAHLTLRATRYQFQQDGAPVHKSGSTKRWLQAKRIRLFYHDNWPPCSPDMNPIEHLWPMVTHKLNGKVFNSKDALWDALKVAFATISPAQVLRLYDSMPNRLQCLKAARGGHTRY